MVMNIEAYLERINYHDHGRPTPTADTLHQLHLAHMLAVPFENLSIHWGEPIILDEQALYEKIVGRRRGGFCYELNGLFATLLRALGFEVQLLSAAVINGEGQDGPPFDHMALLVTLEERWLVDVGFGDSFRYPLRLDERGEQPEGERAYRIEEGADGRLLMSQQEGMGAWQPQYRFDLTPYGFDDYVAMCHYHQTSPDSHFTRRRVCSRATAEGRITLSDTHLIITNNGERQERELKDAADYAHALYNYFGIK